MRWAVEEMLTAGSDTKEHIMDFWLHFVEPFFNLPIRKYEMLGEGSRSDRHKTSVKTAEKSDSSDGEGEGKTLAMESAEGGTQSGWDELDKILAYLSLPSFLFSNGMLK